MFVESSISTCSKSFSAPTDRLWCQSTDYILFKFWKQEDTIGHHFSIKSANRALLGSNMLWMGKQTGAGSQAPGAARAAPPSEKEPGKTRALAAQSTWKRRKGKSRLEMVHFFFFKKSQQNLHTSNCRYICFSCTHQTNLGTGSTVDPGQRWRF